MTALCVYSGIHPISNFKGPGDLNLPYWKGFLFLLYLHDRYSQANIQLLVAIYAILKPWRESDWGGSYTQEGRVERWKEPGSLTTSLSGWPGCPGLTQFGGLFKLLSEVKSESCSVVSASDSSWPQDYTVHRILQARILEWVAFPFSRGSSQPRDHTHVFHIVGGFFTSWTIMEAQEYWSG